MTLKVTNHMTYYVIYDVIVNMNETMRNETNIETNNRLGAFLIRHFILDESCLVIPWPALYKDCYVPSSS